MKAAIKYTEERSEQQRVQGCPIRQTFHQFRPDQEDPSYFFSPSLIKLQLSFKIKCRNILCMKPKVMQWLQLGNNRVLKEETDLNIYGGSHVV